MSSRPSRGAARLAAILDALPDALLLVNCNGTVVNANAIALEAFETPGTALVGRGLLDLLPEFDSKRIPGSMRRPAEAAAAQGRQKPTRMVARRTDGTEFPVEVTSANLEDGRTPYASAIDAAFADYPSGAGYTGDELLMLVVRDLTGTLDTEAELARQQRQTEMILRAASEGVVGVDAAGRVVLVNPAAAQILGYRASDLGGQELHPLVHHSRPDGSPLPFEETPLADTLRSGRKHRVRAGQVLWAKDGRAVPVDMTTAPVRDGDQLVGAVLTFADRRPYDAVTARQSQLRAVLEESLRGPLEELRAELSGLASDPAGQLWPEANQTLHHLSAGYARMTTLVDNVLSYQRLDAGQERLRTEPVPMDAVVSAGVEGAIELIGPGRAQFAVHAPPIEAEVDPERLAVALAHLIADVAGVDATGRAPSAPSAGTDQTIVVAAAQRGEVVRIEVRGPHGGGSPVHEPLVRGVVTKHGGVLQTHEVPGSSGGSAYVLEVPVKAVGNTARTSGSRARKAPAGPAAGTPASGTPGAGTPASGTSAAEASGSGPSRPGAGSGPGGDGGAQGGSTGGGRRARGRGAGRAGGAGHSLGGAAGAREGAREGDGGGFGVPSVVHGAEHGETAVMPMPSAPMRGTMNAPASAPADSAQGPGPSRALALPGQDDASHPGPSADAQAAPHGAAAPGAL
ncbi:PAS domain-containing protein, partial [Streptomyces albus]